METLTFESTGNKKDIHAELHIPEGKTKGIVQVLCDFFENAEYYRDLAEFLCKQGYCVVMADFIENLEDTAFLSNVKIDIYGLFQIAQIKTGKLPVFLLGQGFGSLLARLYVLKYREDLSGIAACSTASGSPTVQIINTVCSFTERFKGRKYHSKLLARLMFGGYSNGKTVDINWMDSANGIMKRQEQFEKGLDVQGYRNIAACMTSANTTGWYMGYPKEIPIAFFSGNKDPFGEFGRASEWICENLKFAEVKSEQFSYEGIGHLVYEQNGQFFNDLSEWLDRISEKDNI